MTGRFSIKRGRPGLWRRTRTRMTALNARLAHGQHAPVGTDGDLARDVQHACGRFDRLAHTDTMDVATNCC
jgi:hypothetical protein